jgi:glycosyltransferase involved in cell wall biosynthesis
MKLAHTAIVTPHQSGLYESVRDLVAAERAAGIDAWIADTKAITEDRGVPINRGIGIADADVIVNHSGLGNYEKGLTKPVVHCLHGRPESSFRLECNGTVGVYSFIRSAIKTPCYRLFVTFWPEFVPYWSVMIPTERLRVVTAPVDVKQWTPDGPDGYKFGSKRGDINIAITDMWREDVTPYHAIHAAVLFADKHPGTKIHMYGVKRTRALDALLSSVNERGCLGEVAGMVTGLANVYRAATMLVSPHRIATRAHREALACGCPVRIIEHADTPIAMPVGNERAAARQEAVEKYSAAKAADEMLTICKEVLNNA